MTDSKDRQADAPTWFVNVVAVVLLVLVASGGVIGWLVVRDAPEADATEPAATAGAGADTSTELRAELIRVAEQYFVEANSYDFTKVEDYKARVHPLMTEQNRQNFDSTLTKIVPGFAGIKAHATGTVRQAAVETLDDDSALVMVTGDAVFDSTRIKRTFFPRWEISLRLVDGSWLVESHTELGDSGVLSTDPQSTGQ